MAPITSHRTLGASERKPSFSHSPGGTSPARRCQQGCAPSEAHGEAPCPSRFWRFLPSVALLGLWLHPLSLPLSSRGTSPCPHTAFPVSEFRCPYEDGSTPPGPHFTSMTLQGPSFNQVHSRIQRVTSAKRLWVSPVPCFPLCCPGCSLFCEGIWGKFEICAAATTASQPGVHSCVPGAGPGTRFTASKPHPERRRSEEEGRSPPRGSRPSAERLSGPGELIAS